MRIYDAIVIYGLLKKIGFSLEEEKDQVLLEYEESEFGAKEENAIRMAKKLKLIPYDNMLDRIKGYLT